ncbi:helix-turn-helix domain-containing protein [Blautia sp. NSJ-175]|uniref:helix-turn-helix domain-containing protein n=1 Tax=Blautia sp. NSJ-175 TaxID=2931396 RepID=UPI001FD12CB5|nr:helix-turn-helix transcriptional regulator [Blautia sp. NSJ-175]MCJ7846613.1 helix-turn-helix domain-containing protein [Blautia sp. NSJ-175]
MFNYGDYIKEKRTKAGLSYDELSALTKISDTSLQRMETGQTKAPKWENLCVIAKALDFHPFEILKAAGYITEEDINPIHRLKKLDKLNDDDINQLQSYIDFLLFQKTYDQQKGTI